MVQIRISNFGRYRNSGGIVYTPSVRSNGYSDIFIKKKHYLVHRLVATVFKLPKQKGQVEVDHIDGDPSNNRLSNLRWCTHAENMQNQVDRGERKSNVGKRSKPVLGRKVGSDEWKEYTSACDASRQLGLSQGNVSACCAGRYSHTGGYEFKFAVQPDPALLDGEEWRQVPGDSGAHVSNKGRFRNAKGVVSTPSTMTSGYVQVGYGGKTHRLHRVIASVFHLPRSPGQNFVNHIDNNPSNNCLSNLEWSTVKENTNHYFQNFAASGNKSGIAQQEEVCLPGEEWRDLLPSHFEE